MGRNCSCCSLERIKQQFAAKKAAQAAVKKAAEAQAFAKIEPKQPAVAEPINETVVEEPITEATPAPQPKKKSKTKTIKEEIPEVQEAVAEELAAPEAVEETAHNDEI